MEIEAKFRVAAADAFERLLAIDNLGDFALGSVRVIQVHDTYLDTADRKILASGYSCRRREYDDRVLITLKGLRKGEGAIHRREEHEISLTEPDIGPAEWPASPVRDLVVQLVGDAPLHLLFGMDQTRHVRPVRAGNRLVGELSLDRVQLEVDRRRMSYYELEVELHASGRESDLLAIVAHLRNEWGVQPEVRSKFEQALVFVAEKAPVERLLTPEERTQCVRLARRDDLHGRRALALLALDEGAGQAAAGQAARMSERRVRYWVAEFRRKRLGIFPARVLAAAVEPILAPEDDIAPEDDVRATLRQAPQPWPLDLLMDRYDVDRSHAQAVAQTALTLFDQLQAVHRLAPVRRKLVNIASQLHDIGLRVDPAHHNVAGHDLLLRQPPAGLNEQECALVAFAALVHGRKARAGKVRKLVGRYLDGLPVDVQSDALAIAALVRVADGLDYSQGNTEIKRVESGSAGVAIDVAGPFATVDAERAASKSDLWADVFGSPLIIRALSGPPDPAPTPATVEAKPSRERRAVPPLAAPEEPPAGVKSKKDTTAVKKRTQEAAKQSITPPGPVVASVTGDAEAQAPVSIPVTVAAPAAENAEAQVPASTPGSLPDEPGLLPDDTMAEGARKTLLFHFQRMLAHEAGTRLGEDPEELHDMRVATRRMRAALPLFEDYLDMEAMQPFQKGLRRTGRMLGAVRDLDVFHEKTQVYLASLPPERQSELGPLLEVWHTERTRARSAMVTYLDSERYRRFAAQFDEFVHTPGAGALPTMSEQGEPVPHRLRHVVPGAVYRRLAEVRSFDEWLAAPDVPLSRYHQLRIASKGLRYALEYFREILGPSAKSLIDAVKGLQDLLGDVNDAVVACNLLRDYLTWGTWGHSPEQAGFADSMIVSPGAAAYLAYRQSELQILLQRFPEVWAVFHGQQFSRWLADAVAEL